MALVKFVRGVTANVDAQDVVDGQLLFDKTTGKLYIDEGTTRHLIAGGDITNITRSGTTFTATKLDGSTFTFTQQDNNTTYTGTSPISVSGTAISHANSGVTTGSYGPSAAVTGTEGTTMNVPYITVNATGHVTAASNKVYTSKNTTYTGTSPVSISTANAISVAEMGAASASAAGTKGIVPAPAQGDQDKFLRGNKTWTDVSTMINLLSEGTSPAQRGDYIVAQYAGGGTTTTTYHRRKLSAIFGALNSSDITTALGYTPPQQDTDTKNTAGSTNTSSKIFLIGATSQAANPQTYSHDTAYVGTDGCLYSGGAKVLTAHQSLSGYKPTQTAVSDPTASGTSVTFISTISQDANGVITPTKKTVATMGAASASAAGTAGLVPAPGSGKQTSFLRGDGTWVVPTNTTYSAASGGGLSLSSNAFSITNSGVTAGTYGPSEDVTGTHGTTINVPQFTVNAKGQITAAANKVYTSVDTDLDTTYADMGGASSSAAGTHGLVPAPAAGKQTAYLRGDGTWVVPTDTKTTTGTSNKTATKLFLAGAASQASSATTYSNANVYIGTDNCLYSNGVKVLTAHQDISGKKNTQSAVSDPTASGNSITFIDTISQDAQGVITPTKKTVSTMGAASSSAAGTAGLVPAPGSGKQASFLRGDGTWVVPTNTTYSAASGGGLTLSSNAFSITNSGVTAGSYGPSAAVTGTEGATMNVPYITVNAKGQITAAANKVYTAKNTTYSTMTAATSSAAGTGGLVPAPAAGKQASFLRGDGTWVVPTNTTYSAATDGGLTLASNAFSITDSGVEAGTYGPEADVTGSDNVTINVPQFTVNAKGQITAAANRVYTSKDSNTNTTNTTGTTNKAATKLFIVGAESQATSPVTYSNANVYIGTDNCLYSNGAKVLTAHQSLSGYKTTQSAVSDPTASGTSVTFIDSISQNANGVITPTKKTVSTMGAASASAAGTAGLVPAPGSGKQTSFLRGDGTWVVPTNTTYSAASGGGLTLSSGAFSITDSGVTAGSYGPSADVTGTEGTTMNVPYITVNAKGQVTAAANKVYTAKNTTYSNMGAATASAAGTAGLVPAPAAGKQTSFLRGDGTWVVPTNTTYSAASGGGLTLSSNAFSITDSGVTAGSYGPSANVTGNDGTTMNVPYITVNAKGQITAASNKVYTAKNTANTDTKNTAGSTNKTGTKLFLIGAESQAANPVTYSNASIYIDTGNRFHSEGRDIILQNTNASWDRDGTAPSSSITGNSIAIWDKDGERIGLMRTDLEKTTGVTGLNLGSFTEQTDATEVGTWLRIRAYRDGSHQITTNAQMKWDSGALPKLDADNANMWPAMFDENNILCYGSPKMAHWIVEMGNTAPTHSGASHRYGRWIKYSNGYAHQWMQIDWSSLALTTAHIANMIYTTSGQHVTTFGLPFNSVPYFNYSPTAASDRCLTIGMTNLTKTAATWRPYLIATAGATIAYTASFLMYGTYS